MVIFHSYVSLPEGTNSVRGGLPLPFRHSPVERWPPFIILELLHLRSHIINFPGQAVETQHEPEPQDIHRHHLFDVDPSTSFGGR